MERWAVAVTRPQAEERALANLAFQGYDAYLPKASELVIRKGQKVHEIKPLFPRYLFVWIEGQWSSILGTVGVSTLLFAGDRPAFLPAGLISEIRARECKSGYLILKTERFKRNQKVCVQAGPFSGLDGLYQGMDAQRREVVLLSFFNRSLTITFEAAGDLAAA